MVSAPAALTALTDEVSKARLATPDELRAKHAVEFDAALGYDPLTASNLDSILTGLGFQAPAAAKVELAKTGFVTGGHDVPSFAAGYSGIYAADLPVFVSADMVLEAIYRSHDKILQSLETKTLRPRLQKLLTTIRASLASSADTLESDVASDLNFYLGVATSLLDGGRVDERESAELKSFVAAAMKAEGEQERVLFGTKRLLDFSQFKPRGHYDGDPNLESYFRAMIWLGRIEFRLIETNDDGSQLLRRRQVESVVALRKLLDAAAYSDYLSIDATIGAFVGEHDYMALQQVDALLASVGGAEGLADVSDDALAEAIIAGEFGEQRIASQVIRRNPGGQATFPLSMSFALFGQRYTVDSHVFSNVVYDRLPTRVVPDPLDVAFAALGNDQALGLLGDELDQEAEYPGALSAMRLLVDAHPEHYWQSSLYTSWLSALRTLSPAATPATDLPSVARSDAWGRRLLNTQLSSWAQLRHNNVLYVKQSYTSAAACEYPEAYVDPYPEFFQGVARFAERAQELVAGLDLDAELGKRMDDYFAAVARINLTLADMALAQRSGMPHSAEHMAFINQAVTTEINCDGTLLGHTGWYSELHFEPLEAVEMDPAITDVHTDVGGELPVARNASVLHVGTGLPRPIVLTVDSCNGPRAYAGVISTYNELLADGLTRLTDAEWKQRLEQGNVPRTVPWLAPVFGEQP
ncbi:MAG TPA: DUF3160 domain-containing protein [Polyangiaceae bacterium]